jgi:hypothetical protein
VLFGQHGPAEADECGAVGEDADDVGAPADLLVESFLGFGPDLSPNLFEERGERQQIRAGGFKLVRSLGAFQSVRR